MERKKTSSQAEISERKSYEPPRIVYREPLEAVAVICSGQQGGKGGGDPSCNLLISS